MFGMYLLLSFRNNMLLVGEGGGGEMAGIPINQFTLHSRSPIIRRMLNEMDDNKQ